jgi:hypothetical protein
VTARSTRRFPQGPLPPPRHRRVAVALHPAARDALRRVSQRTGIGPSALVTRWLRAYLERGRPARPLELPPTSRRADVGLSLPADLLQRVRERLAAEGGSLAGLIAHMAATEDSWLDPERRRRTLVSLLHQHRLDWVADRPEAVEVLVAQAQATESDPDAWMGRLADLLRQPGAPREPAAGAVLVAVLRAWCESSLAGLPEPARRLRTVLREWISSVYQSDDVTRDFREGVLATADAIARITPALPPPAALLLLYMSAPQGARLDSGSLRTMAEATERLAQDLDKLIVAVARTQAPFPAGAHALTRLATALHQAASQGESAPTRRNLLLEEAWEKLFPQGDDNTRRAIRLLRAIEDYSEDEIAFALDTDGDAVRRAISEGARVGEGEFRAVRLLLERARREARALRRRRFL